MWTTEWGCRFTTGGPQYIRYPCTNVSEALNVPVVRNIQTSITWLVSDDKSELWCVVRSESERQLIVNE